jgi:hypothetical protein
VSLIPYPELRVISVSLIPYPELRVISVSLIPYPELRGTSGASNIIVPRFNISRSHFTYKMCDGFKIRNKKFTK